MAKVVKISCPHCKRSLEVKRSGEHRCPACQRPVRVPATAFDDVNVPAEVVAMTNEASTGVAALLRRQQTIVAIGVASVLLIVAGIWWLNSGRSTVPPTDTLQTESSDSQSPLKPKTKASGTSSDDDQEQTQSVEKSNSPTVAATKRKPRGIPLFDADVGNSSSNNTPSTPEASAIRTTGTKNGPTKSASGSPNVVAMPWANVDWAVLVSAGDAPRLNGVAVWMPPPMSNSGRWPLVVPTGKAVWQASEGAEPRVQVVSQPFAEHYRREQTALQTGGQLQFEKLCEATRPSLGAFRDPLLPHFWGNYFWHKEDPDAAIRFWKLAVRVQPTFAPAHVNLAFAFAGRGDAAKAKNELAIAARLNPLDAFGVEAHLNLLREQLGWWAAVETEPRWSESDYAAATANVSGEAQQVVNVLRTFAQYATHAADRSRALNNAGVYLAQQKQHEAAVSLFQEALVLVADLPPADRDRELRNTVFGNLERSAKEARLAEHALYGWLREASR